MAKVKEAKATFQRKARRKRPGVHAKTKYSKSKNSKNYAKLSVGQG
jgi:hypothetical protein